MTDEKNERDVCKEWAMTDDKNEREREHCEQVALRDLLLSVRASAFAQGKEEGRAELQPLLDTAISKQLHAVELVDLADDAEARARQELSDAEHGYATIKTDLAELQARYDCLESAADAVVRAREFDKTLQYAIDYLIGALSPPSTSTQDETSEEKP